MKIKIERHHGAATRVQVLDVGDKREAVYQRVQELLREATLPIMAKDSQFHYTITHQGDDIEVMLHSKWSHLADATAEIRKQVHAHLVRKGHEVELKASDAAESPL